MSEDQILDLIIDRYLEKHPRKENYAVKITSFKDDDRDSLTFYYDLSDELKEIVRKWSIDNEGCETLGEYLEGEEGGPEIVEKWLDDLRVLDYNYVDSCDLNDIRKKTIVKVYVLGEDGNICESYNFHPFMSDDEFRQAIKLFITRWNRVSANMLTYLMPEFSQGMMSSVVNSYYNRVCEFTKPFCVEMTEIHDIVESIMNPMKDELGLFDSEDKEVKAFVEKYALVPDTVQIFEDGKDAICYHVYASFTGNKLNIGHEKMDVKDWFPVYLEDDDVYFNANKICNHFNFSSYDDLMNYLTDHFKTETAFNDICEFINTNCPESIIK